MSVSINGAGSITGIDQGFNVTSGVVGIGTDVVGDKLVIHQGSDDDVIVRVNGADSSSEFAAMGVGSGYAAFVAGGTGTTNTDMVLMTSLSGVETERLRITSDGKLLIGSDTGSVHGNRLLQVGKTDRSETYVSIVSSTSGESGLLFADTTTNDTGGYRGQIRYHHSDDSMNFRTGASERVRIDSSGNLLLKTGEIDIQGGNKTVKTSAGFLQVGTSGSHYLSLITAGSQRLNITSGGQVNIGGNLTQTGFTASITRNSSETDILRIKGNGGNAFVRFEDNDASSSFTLGADDAVGSGGFALYDRSDSAYRVVVDTAGRVSINATSPVPLDGQTPYLYVASGYTNLDGLRIRGLDTGNTLWKTGGDMSLSVASNDAINLKTNGTSRFVLNANSNNSTTLSIGNGSNLTNNTSPDRTSVKIGGTLHLEASFQGQNHRTGMYYNCYASGQTNFYQGTFGASSFDYRAAAATMSQGAFKVYTDPSTSTNYSAGAQITTMKETLTCANGFVLAPNQPCFWATSNTGGSDTSNGYTGIISNQFEAAYVNVGNHYNTSTGVFTCPVAGTYEFHGQGLIRHQSGVGRAELSFYKNGSNTISRSYGYTYITGASDHDNLHVMGYITCAANDQIDFRVYACDSGIDVYWGQGLGYFAGRLVQ